MTVRCDSLHAYVDGELDEPETAEFESHLATCTTCLAELPQLLELLAALDGAAEHAAEARPETARLTLIPGGRAAAVPGSAASGGVASAAAAHGWVAPAEAIAAPATGGPRREHRRRAWWIAGAGMATAAAAAIALLIFRSPAPTPRPDALAALDAALGPTRPIEARFGARGADRYRPVNVQRGAGPSSAASEPLFQLERELEQAGNWHGAAVTALLAGDREHAVRAFAKAPDTPEVDSDRAVLELLDGSPAALERALEDADRALAAAPNSGAAHWNRGLALAAMNLPLAAAKEFAAVRTLNEPGWADEARTRGDALRAQLVARRTHWKQAFAAGQRMVEDGTPAPADLADVSGTMTFWLYDAVRAAPSRERALALLPLARKLDGVYRNTRLASYIERIAASDFPVRKPLADRYREIALGRAAAGAADALLRQLPRAGADDLRMGALVYANRVAAEIEDYRRLVAATGDPWFQIIAEQAAAAAEIARGDTAAGERRLRDALDLARREHLAYRAIRLEGDLVKRHKDALELSQAAVEARDAYRDAVAAGEWVLEMGLVSDLASIHQNRYAYSLARAYLTELAERADAGLGIGDDAYASVECARRIYAYGSLAHISLLQPTPDPDRARAELAAVPVCHMPMTDDLAVMILRNALVRTELYRLGRRADDARLARDSLATVRDVPAAVLPGKDAFLAYIEGELTIADDPTSGRRALREAITRAGQDAHEFSLKARAYGFSLLALEEGRAGAFDQVAAVMAESLSVRAPERCALAVAADEQRQVVAFRDAHGASGGEYVTRKPGALDVAHLVPASVVARVRDCDHVAVLTRAPVLGAGRLLPPELAWSYVLTDPAAATAPAAAAARRLVVANPATPPDLGLPPLGPYPDQPGDDTATVLRGPDATPGRVLLAMQDASIIEFHTHGLLADDVFEASHLVLSPELDQHYALTARDVARVRLAAAPLVILGACHAATSSHVLEGGMGLPEAFLRAGASAVIASPDAVQDRGAYEFFAAVRDRVVHGADPAAALRDERVRQLAASHDDTWVSGVVVFQ